MRDEEYKIYDARAGKMVPVQDCGYMEEWWLEAWGSTSTTLDALDCCRRLLSRVKKLESELSSIKSVHAIAAELKGIRDDIAAIIHGDGVNHAN